LPSRSSDHDPLRRIEHALIRLEMGQHHNREAGQQRVEGLAHHFDTRLTELRHDLGSRMDRMDTRIKEIEHRPPSVPSPTPAPSSTPWWAEMSLRERLIWTAAAIWIALLMLRPDIAETMRTGLLLPLLGHVPK
jgi:hypothetical protein